MTRYVAFLRAINVGRHVVKMDHLRALFEQSGFANVKTFIASGNVLFDSAAKNPAALEAKLAKALRNGLGYDVAVFIRTAPELNEICEQSGDVPPSGGSLFIGFLPEPLDAREKKIVASLETAVDALRLHKREIYWLASKNFRDAIFQPAKLEKQLGKLATFRNVTTVRKIAALMAKPLLLLVLLLTAPAQAQVPGGAPAEVVAHRVTVLRDWVGAVLRHKPGEADAAALMTSTWSAEDLRDAWLDVNVLNALLRRPAQTTFTVQQWGRPVRVEIDRQDLRAMRATAEALIRSPGADMFRKRAAIFHMDVALFVVGEAAGTPMYSSFLLPRRILVRSGDGEQEGVHGGDVNWEFARVLLDAVREPGADEGVRLWYRATMAYKLLHEHLDRPHFDRALALLPQDADILFLNGALHDAFADPRVQTIARAAAGALPSGTRLDVESEKDHLQKAESLFRRAFEADPEHVESRLRHARVLGRLGRHADAAARLRDLNGTNDRLLSYYAHLFLGAEEEALGRLDQARLAYDKAATLFPRAQAPRIALSQLSHRSGNRVAARAALAPALEAPLEDDSEDPWWVYRISPGRFADDLVAAMYRSIAGLQGSR